MTDIQVPETDVAIVPETPEELGPRVLAIVGPTAIGKTGVAEEIAVRLGTELVSADSMQVYRHMDIGTAKPPLHQRRVQYWCLDLVEPGTPFSAALYQGEARTAIDDIADRGMTPMMVGGTGLYLRAALDRMEFPAGERQDSPTRGGFEEYAATHGTEALYALLVERDPVSAAVVHRNNTRRVIRALEMLDVGVSYANQREGFASRHSLYDAHFVGLTMPRDKLYARIEARVDAMLEAGLLSEIEKLLDEGFRDAIIATQAIGYKEFVPVLEGKLHLRDAVATVKQSTRRYAKRQLAWFRADPRVLWVDVTDSSVTETADKVMAVLESPTP